jgi:glutaredoxin-like protein
MAMLTDQDREFLQDRFRDELKDDVTIIAFTKKPEGLESPGLECEFCRETEELMIELKELSNKIKLDLREFSSDDQMAKDLGIDKLPALILTSSDASIKAVRYFGIPGGFEFSSLVEDIIDLSRRSTDLDQSTKDKVKGVQKDIHIQVFFTPTCPYCPIAVRTAHQMAMENPQHIKADAIEAAEFPDLIDRYEIQAVPTIVINEEIQFEGALPEDEFTNHIMEAVA